MTDWLYKLIGWLFVAGGITISITVNVDWSKDAVPPVKPDDLGWNQEAVGLAAPLVESMPRFQISGDDGQDNETKNVRLWTFSQAVLDGQHIPNIAQQTGDCVSFAAANAVMYLQAKQLALDRRHEQFRPIFPPHIYGGSRVTIGKGQIRGAGSVGAWAAEWVREAGVLRSDIPGVPAYSGRIADEWGRRGVPAEFIEASKPYKIETVALVRTAKQARDAICNGYPVTIASDFGTKTIKPVDGRMVATWNGRWLHAMCLIAYDGSGKEPLFYCLNSWGPNAHPKPLQGEPPGGFWIRFNDVERIVRQGDSFAYSDFTGFPAKEIDFTVFGAQANVTHDQAPFVQEANMPFAITIAGLLFALVGAYLIAKPHRNMMVALACIIAMCGASAHAAEPVSFAAFGVAEAKTAMTPDRVSFACFGCAEELPATSIISEAWTLESNAAKQKMDTVAPIVKRPTWQWECDGRGRCYLVWR